MVVWHCVLTKILDKIFKNYTYFMSNMTKQKNEALTQKYFSNMALEQKSLSTPVIDHAIDSP